MYDTSGRYRDDPHGDDRNRENRHKDDRLGNRRRGSDPYGGDPYRDGRRCDSTRRDEGHSGGNPYGGNDRYNDRRYDQNRFRDETRHDIARYPGETRHNIARHDTARYDEDRYGWDGYGDERYGDEYYDNEYYDEDGYDEASSGELPAAGRQPPRWVRRSLLPASIILWAIGVATANTSTIGLYGLPANLPAVFYVGLGLLIISAGFELAARKLSPVRLGLHAGALAVILYGTAALVYADGRYAWLYKTLGVVQYIDANGHVTQGIDIYQSWPGFFALAAWFDHVAGVGGPMNYAKWAQLVFELAALPLLYSIYTSLALPVRHRWLALLLYSAGNWIAQDYFSPQALSTVLSLGIMALALRWMRAGNTLGHLARDEELPPQRSQRPGRPGRRGPRPRAGPTRLGRRGSVPFLVAILLLIFVLVFTHELSPYIVAVQLVALAAVGQMRPRWLPLAAVGVTIAYLVPNFSYVNSHYGLLSSLGSFFSNASGTSSGLGGTPPESQHIIGDCADLLSVGMWLLSLIGAWIRRKSWRTVIALLFLTFSPVLVLFGGSYGGEGIMRVYLFSLPWAAALAASALVPVRRLDQALAEPGGGEAPDSTVLGKFDRGTMRAPVALAVTVALFLPAFFGNDSSNVMSQSQVTTTAAFLNSAKPGMILCPDDNSSVSSTARYDQFPIGVIFGEYGIITTDPSKMNIAAYLARTVVNYTHGVAPGYVLITPSMTADNTAYGYIPANYFTTLERSLRTSPYWKAIVNTGGTLVYEVTPAANDIPTGPYNADPVLTVP